MVDCHSQRPTRPTRPTRPSCPSCPSSQLAARSSQLRAHREESRAGTVFQLGGRRRAGDRLARVRAHSMSQALGHWECDGRPGPVSPLPGHALQGAGPPPPRPAPRVSGACLSRAINSIQSVFLQCCSDVWTAPRVLDLQFNPRFLGCTFTCTCTALYSSCCDQTTRQSASRAFQISRAERPRTKDHYHHHYRPSNQPRKVTALGGLATSAPVRPASSLMERRGKVCVYSTGGRQPPWSE